ncbi:MAG: HipA domain-containing protein [Chitinophagaceae bacterium]|nr:HipA domain-containing protein [Chitinophagaceae bacterium]MCW5925540.1 HipA domain-containing protein [Chitinophagaceae bacterium]
MCPGCYRPNVEGYCPNCRKQLFDGARVSSVLPFDQPKADNLSMYQEKTRRLSISGVQLKYSLRLEDGALRLTEKGGQYIIKPVPPTTQITHQDQAPENEHLTMQIASRVFGIQTAANALIYFKDGAPAYITRRFDVKPDGSKYLQEDMAQISGASRQTRGENFKYEGTYEDIGHLIKKHVAAAQPALERFFQLVLFNYIFSNGDAHLKNFSLIQTTMGDYTLTPAYDLMSTVLHTPHESDMALECYEKDMETSFYSKWGYFGQHTFRTLAEKIGIQPVRSSRIITRMLEQRNRVTGLISSSFLSDDVKQAYQHNYFAKLQRMGMTEDMIASAIDPVHPGVYAVTTTPTRLTFIDGSVKDGYFDTTSRSHDLAAENKYSFIELSNATDYRNTRDQALVTIVDGDLLIGIEHPMVG